MERKKPRHSIVKDMHKTACCVFLSLFISSAIVLFFSGNSTHHHHPTEDTLGEPWYRIRKAGHEKIPVSQAAHSSFGHHFIPKDDVYVAPRWTELEFKHIECMDLGCACGFYGGIASGKMCILPDGQKLQRAVRKELRMHTDDERKAIEKALNAMMLDGTYHRIGRVHKYAGVHAGPAFIVWHREFLKRFELIMRKYLPSPHTLGMPYWDSSLDAALPDPTDSIMFTEVFFGDTDDNDQVVTGPYANWTTMEGKPAITRKVGEDEFGELFSHAVLQWVVNQTDINNVLAATSPLSSCNTDIDERFLEFSHDYVHFFIGGDMAPSWSASNDVIFHYHHAMVDHIFELFRHNSQDRQTRTTAYPATNNQCFPPWHNVDASMHMLGSLKNKDGLSNDYTDHMYEYEARPTCDAVSKDCGSKYLFCNTFTDEKPFCMSKIRPGGNCTGYEGTHICYGTACVNGICNTTIPLAQRKVEDKFINLKSYLNM